MNINEIVININEYDNVIVSQMKYINHRRGKTFLSSKEKSQGGKIILSTLILV